MILRYQTQATNYVGSKLAAKDGVHHKRHIIVGVDFFFIVLVVHLFCDCIELITLEECLHSSEYLFRPLANPSSTYSLYMAARSLRQTTELIGKAGFAIQRGALKYGIQHRLHIIRLLFLFHPRHPSLRRLYWARHPRSVSSF